MERDMNETAMTMELESLAMESMEYDTEEMTVGRVIGIVFEVLWTMIKLAVVVSVVVGVVGFFLSRELVIRGRNGSLQSLKGMQSVALVSENRDAEKASVQKWLKKVKREKMTLETDDGCILVARKIVAPNSDNWAVVLHGYNGSMEDIYDIAMHYAEKDYNILMPDLRACGESEGSFIGMGWLDRLDIINWIDVIIQDNPSAKIVVHGVDMGADAALMLSGEPLKSPVRAVVAEGAYTSAWDVLKKEYKVRHASLPVFPVLNMAAPVMKVWGGYTLKEADAVKQVKNAHVPILYIQGTSDTYVTQDMTEQLAEATVSNHQVLYIPSGTHEDCRYVQPDTYYNKIFEFVGSYVQ